MKVEIRSKVVILLCIVLAVFSSCITDDDDDRGDFALVAGDALPQFSVEMSDGGVLNTQSFSGKVGVIVFFHTDCPDCQKELPVIQKVYDTYKENPDVLLSCISRSESGSEVQAYWEKHSFSLPFPLRMMMLSFRFCFPYHSPYIDNRQGGDYSCCIYR